MGVCPPVARVSPEFQARAAEALKLLPGGSAVVEMLGDHAIMREQAQACR